MSRAIVVIGDSMLDVDVLAQADRLCPDAPAPVLHDPVSRPRPGGAALTALIAAAEHPHVVLVTPVGDDEAGEQLRRLLRDRLELVPVPMSGSTPVKTRLRAGEHVVARIDTGGERGSLGALPSAASRALAEAAAVLVSDYGGAVTSDPRIRRLLAGIAASTPLVWDPHPRGGEPVAGARLVTPNAREARHAVPDITGESLSAVRRRAAALVERWSAASVAVTLGEGGCVLSFGAGAPLVMPAPAVRAADTCGAGDCFAAAASSAFARGALASDAAARAVEAATEFVAAGAAGALLDGRMPAAAARRPKDDVEALLRRIRARSGCVVSTGGCFDLLHAGHVATLEAARRLGDCLIVCLNSDDSARRLKGDGRPLQPAADRGRVLSALRCVDAVVVFDEDTPIDVLRRLRPDVWVKGGDYAGAALPEAAVLDEWNGEVVTLPYLGGRSTTELVGLAQAMPQASR